MNHDRRKIGDNEQATGDRAARHTRGAAATERILSSARQLLASQGYASFTMETVAAAAGVSRSTLYRRWGSKQELVVACGHTFTVAELQTEDHGSFAADIRHLITTRLSVVDTDAYATIQAAVLAAVAEAPALQAEVVERNLLRLQITEDVICRGQERGEVRTDVDPQVLRLLVSAPLFFSIVQLAEHPDDSYVNSLVDLIVRAAAK